MLWVTVIKKFIFHPPYFYPGDVIKNILIIEYQVGRGSKGSSGPTFPGKSMVPDGPAPVQLNLLEVPSIGESPLPGEIILLVIILILQKCFSCVQAESPQK